MPSQISIRPLLTAMHRYDKSLSTWGRGAGRLIEAPILSYLIETPHGRLLYDVGCDYHKIADPHLRAQFYDATTFPFGAPDMADNQRIPKQLARLGLTVADIDLVVLGHLHFDHAGGLCDLCGVDVHVQQAEVEAASSHQDVAYFSDEVSINKHWKLQQGEYEVVPGVRIVSSPGHTAGHASLWIELSKGSPILLAGDAADLTENLDDEVAPGICWQDQTDVAIASIRKLKALAQAEGAELWPNHDIAFWQQLTQRA